MEGTVRAARQPPEQFLLIVLALLSDPEVVHKILNHLGIPTCVPALAPARSSAPPHGGTASGPPCPREGERDLASPSEVGYRPVRRFGVGRRAPGGDEATFLSAGAGDSPVHSGTSGPHAAGLCVAGAGREPGGGVGERDSAGPAGGGARSGLGVGDGAGFGLVGRLRVEGQ